MNGTRAKRGGLALVMGGGGARAAYQAGLLQRVARELPDIRVPILTGVSAGAINTVKMAALPGTFRDKAEALAAVWADLSVEKVFRVSGAGLFARVLRWGICLLSGGHPAPPPPRGLVDTAPLWGFLTDELGAQGGRLPGIQRNLDAGVHNAVAITASSYSTGRSVTWVQSREGFDFEGWERPHRTGSRGQVTLAHVMASAALPLIFPAVEVGEAWFGDGGIRLTAPLSPAIHLGAEHILVISTRRQRPAGEAIEASVVGYPPLAQVAGVLLNAIFLDLLDGDALRLQRINQLVERAPEGRRDGLRRVELLVLRPSRDLGRLANDYEAQLPRAFRFLTRGLGTQATRSNDLLSLVMFQPDYLKRLVDLGREDAEARLDEIVTFLRHATR